MIYYAGNDGFYKNFKRGHKFKANLTVLLASMVLPDFSLIIVPCVPRIQEEWTCLYVQYFCYGPKACLTSLKKNYNWTWKRTKKKRTIKTYNWDVLYSKWFQCVLDDESEGSLYPLFIDQSTSPSSSTTWLASFLMFPKLSISIYWRFALWSIYGITRQIIVQ